MATMLSNAIKFRSLSHQLTKQEFKEFLNKMIDHNKTNLITTSFFNYFIKNNNCNDDLSDINSILSNIIQSRKQKPKLHSKTNMKLNQLPQSVIGYVGSFLDQIDYFDYEKTNRSIFIGCNSPNMLSMIRLRFLNNYSPINLSKYHNVKTLYIHLPLFKQFSIPNNGQIIMHQLNELLLDAQETDVNIEPFMSSNCFNFQNIKSLRLDRFGGDINDFNLDTLYRLFTKFPNVENIEFINLFVSDEFNALKLKQLCPNLNGLSITGGHKDTVDKLINGFENNLQFLTYDVGIHSDLSNVNFNKLQQVMLNDVNAKMVNEVLKTGKNIQKFAVTPHCNVNKKEFKTIINKILKGQSIQYLQIEVNDQNVNAILDGIENGLYETIKYKRKQLKIRISAQENFT
eukprot:373149_1